MLAICRFRWLPCLLLAAAVNGVSPIEAADPGGSKAPAPSAAGTFDDQVKSLLGTYCVGCHGATKQKGDRRFDRLSSEIPDDNALVDL
jgi:cytochrome c553